MIQELLPLLPTRLGTAGLAVAGGGGVLGMGLWLAGARFSRSLLAIAATAVGGAVGFELPAWFGWSIDPMATAVAGALILGVAGFLAHGLLAGLGLGTVLAIWGAIAALAITGAGWNRPAMGSGESIGMYLTDVFHSLPHDVAKILPYVCAVAFVASGVVAALWLRVSVVMLWSTAGLTLALGLGIAIAHSTRPDVLRVIPTQAWAQAIVLGAMVAFGAVFQWNLAPASRAASPPAPSPQPKPATKPKAVAKPRRIEVDD